MTPPDPQNEDSAKPPPEGKAVGPSEDCDVGGKGVVGSSEKEVTPGSSSPAAVASIPTDDTANRQGHSVQPHQGNMDAETSDRGSVEKELNRKKQPKLRMVGIWAFSTIVGFIVAFIGGYYANKINDDRKDNRDAASKEVFIKQIKSITAASCVKQVAEFNYMIQSSRKTGMIGLNAYLLPKFPNSLKDQLINSTGDIISHDKEFATLLPVLGGIDYQSTFATKDASGTIFGSPVYNYIHDIDQVCKWASGRRPSGSMFDLSLIP